MVNCTIVSSDVEGNEGGNHIYNSIIQIAERTTPNKLRNLNTVRGQRVTLNLNIAPTYLGVLSEPDLDNPTIKIQ